MSPEQARGAPVDRRADIWAFGVSLYEMLAGKAVFARESITETLATVMRDEPDWTALPARRPERIRRLLSALSASRRETAAAGDRRSADRSRCDG